MEHQSKELLKSIVSRIKKTKAHTLFLIKEDEEVNNLYDLLLFFLVGLHFNCCREDITRTADPAQHYEKLKA